MKIIYYTDGICHHYKKVDKYTVINVCNSGNTACIDLQDFGETEHYLKGSIKDKIVKPCTKKVFDTAFAKALNTINNLK